MGRKRIKRLFSLMNNFVDGTIRSSFVFGMMRSTLQIFFFVLTVGISLTGVAQTMERQLVTPFGGTSTTATLYVHSSVGEPVAATYESTNTNTISGLQQPVSWLFTDIAIAPANIPAFAIYPNPASDYTILESSLEGTYQLLDEAGKLLQQGNLAANKNRIELNELPAGAYLLRVVPKGNHPPMTYKLLRF